MRNLILILTLQTLIWSQATFRYGLTFTDDQGEPLKLTRTLSTVEFLLWPYETGGVNPVWKEVFINVPVKDGFLELVVGKNGYPAGELPDLQVNRYVEIKVQVEAIDEVVTLSPRSELPVLPVAMSALRASKLDEYSFSEIQQMITAGQHQRYQDSEAITAAYNSTNPKFLTEDRIATLNADLNVSQTGRLIFSEATSASTTKIKITNTHLVRDVFWVNSTGYAKASTWLGDGRLLENVVHTKDTQTISGTKTFTALNTSFTNTVTAGSFSGDGSLITSVVHNFGNENIDGSKTFLNQMNLKDSILFDFANANLKFRPTANPSSAQARILVQNASGMNQFSLDSTGALTANRIQATTFHGDGASITNLKVTTEYLFSHVITNDKIHPDAITTDKISNASILTQDIANLQITSSLISQGAVTSGKISGDIILSETLRVSKAFSKDGSNRIYGNTTSSHVNLGFNSQTGQNGQNYAYMSVGGGRYNTAQANFSHVGGGEGNLASGGWSLIGGGLQNLATNDYSLVSGGFKNLASGIGSSVSGGRMNTAAGNDSSISGGLQNKTLGQGSFIGGGRNLNLLGDWSFGYNASASLVSVTTSAAGVFMGVRMGLETTSPKSRLEVIGNSTLPPLIVRTGALDSQRALIITTSGKIGIHTVPTTGVMEVNGILAVRSIYFLQDGNSMSTVSPTSGAFIHSGNRAYYSNPISVGTTKPSSATLLIQGSLSRDFSNQISGLTTSHVVLGQHSTAGSVLASHISIGGGLLNTATASFATISGGYGNVSTNSAIVIAGGTHNQIHGDFSVVSGGFQNLARANLAVISGGEKNMVLSTGSLISGGGLNVVNGVYSSISGGKSNLLSGADYSSVSGGNFNTAWADFSFLGGGIKNSILQIANYGVVSGGESNRVQGPYGVVSGGKSNLVSGYGVVSGGLSNQVLGNYSAIAGGTQLTITGERSFGFNAGSSAQIISRSGVVAFPGASMGVGTTNPTVELEVAGSIKANHFTGNGQMSLNGFLSRSTLNRLIGTNQQTHLNLGIDSQTGKTGFNYQHVSVAGGYRNTAEGDFSSIGGGQSNYAIAQGASISGGGSNAIGGLWGAISGGYLNDVAGQYGFVGGGYKNSASGNYASAVAGQYNTASAIYSFSGAGKNNLASGNYSVVAGGQLNRVENQYSSILGGVTNLAQGDYGTIGGGQNNQAIASNASVFGGLGNIAKASASTVVGGEGNTAAQNWSFVGGGRNNQIQVGSGSYGAISGGQSNIVSANWASVSGGQANTIEADWGFIGGGRGNRSTAGNYTTVGGGLNNEASGDYPAVLGGSSNTAIGNYAFIGGGQTNNSSSFYSVVAGGLSNTASNQKAAVVGGESNTASALHSFVGGGQSNQASATHAAVVGGQTNVASAAHAVVGGGQGNDATQTHSTVSGGRDNLASNTYATVSGGQNNTASGSGVSVSGGIGNSASGNTAHIGGGENNTITSGDYSVISGGFQNSVSGSYSAVLGGRNLNITSNYAYGINAQVTPATISKANVFALTGVDMAVGTTNPAARVDIVGSASVDALKILTDAGALNPAIFVKKDGKVGIHTSNPTVSFEVNGKLKASILEGNAQNLVFGANQSFESANMSKNLTVAGFLSMDTNNQMLGSDTSTHINLGVQSVTGVNGALREYTSVLGGRFNTATADHSTIFAGTNNFVSGQNSLILGGSLNSVTGSNSVILGGNKLTISNSNSMGINLGNTNQTISNSKVVAFLDVNGVGINQASPQYPLDVNGNMRATSYYGNADNFTWPATLTVNALSGTNLQFIGSFSHASSNRLYGTNSATHINLGIDSETGTNGSNFSYASVGGGYRNTASADYSAVFGGNRNRAGAQYSVVGGGQQNLASGLNSSVLGGEGNQATKEGSFIGGGKNNKIQGSLGTNGQFSVIAGGEALTVEGHHVFGFNGSSTPVMITDDQVASFMSVKMGIGTTSPKAALHVASGGLCVSSGGCSGNVAGTVYATNTTVQGADYAEYFDSSESMNPGDLVALDTKTGKVRRYKSGDFLVGVISTNPGILGNDRTDKKNSAAVALMGQVPVNMEQVVNQDGQIYTKDGNLVGFLLASKNVYLQIRNEKASNEILLSKIKLQDIEIMNQKKRIHQMELELESLKDSLMKLMK